MWTMRTILVPDGRSKEHRNCANKGRPGYSARPKKSPLTLRLRANLQCQVSLEGDAANISEDAISSYPMDMAGKPAHCMISAGAVCFAAPGARLVVLSDCCRSFANAKPRENHTQQIIRREFAGNAAEPVLRQAQFFRK